MSAISIVTATLNAASTVADCINSVRQQSMPVEHIIVDGSSTDDTLAILERATSGPSDVSYVITSNRDEGMYDAMNKGISNATGDIVGILNSDDVYAADDVLRSVMSVFDNPSTDACYSDLIYVDPIDPKRVIRTWTAGEFTAGSFYWGWMPPHPTFFARRSVYERFGAFNTDLGTAADYELMLRFLLKHRLNAAYIRRVLVRMRHGGSSNRAFANRVRANMNDRRAWEINGLKPYPWTLWMKPIRKIPQFFSI